MEAFGRILALKSAFLVVQGAFELVIWSQNWPKVHEIWHFGHFSIIFASKKIDMNPFLVVLIYGVFWENMSLLTYFLGSVRGLWVVHMVPKLVKLHEIWHFGHFLIIFTSKKIELNPFSGSTILWSILREYEHFNVLCW